MSVLAGIPQEPFLAWLDGKFALFWSCLPLTLLLAIAVWITSERPMLSFGRSPIISNTINRANRDDGPNHATSR